MKAKSKTKTKPKPKPKVQATKAMKFTRIGPQEQAKGKRKPKSQAPLSLGAEAQKLQDRRKKAEMAAKGYPDYDPSPQTWSGGPFTKRTTSQWENFS